jgi:transcriptional regulator with XRE-family HTH domain
MFQQRLCHVVCSTAQYREPMVTEEHSGDKKAYSQDDIDALAYSYVLSHGYEGALALLDALLAHGGQDDGAPDGDLAVFCRRILDAIHDEAATIFRILNRMIVTPPNGVRHPMAAVSIPGPNPIDRHIGHRLRQRRSELGLSLARMAADLALAPDALALIEQGATRLDAVALERAVKRLDVPAAYFFRTLRSEEDASSTAQSLTGRFDSASRPGRRSGTATPAVPLSLASCERRSSSSG